MTALFWSPGPRVFAVAPGDDVAAALASGLRARLRDGGAPPHAIARVGLTLNTRRAARAVVEAFEHGRDAAYLPRIATLDDALADPAAAPPGPAISRTRRLLRLTRLAQGFLDNRPKHGPRAAAPALAAALADLLDDAEREDVDLSRIADLAPEAHDAAWRDVARFLQIAAQAWPRMRAEDGEGAHDPETARRAAVARLEADWAAAPPTDPLIVAGSTGSRAVTARYLRAVAALPQGALVLPGFDPDAAAAVWDAIDDSHPWGAMARLLRGMGLGPGDVRWWRAPPPDAAPRRRLWAEAMRPAPRTDGWTAALPDLRREAAAALDGVTLVLAPDVRAEAGAIAHLLREAVAATPQEPGVRAALVTPDRVLARHTTAALARWDLRPDDSGGRPLALTPPGVFLKLIARTAFGPFDPVDLLALLKHPLCGAGDARGPHLLSVHALDLRVLRRDPALPDLAAAARGLEAAGAVAPEAAGAVAPETAAPAAAAIATLQRAAGATAELAAQAKAHSAAAEALSGGAVWRRETGRAARAALDALIDGARDFGPSPPADYPALFAAALDGAVREESYLPDPRIAVWGPLEARMRGAELIVLGGLNEGGWPQTPPADPWMSREMRAALGLPPPERRLGLAAHDVMTAGCRPRVALTRRARDGGAPTTASRWLARLTTLAAAADADALAAARARGDAALAAAAQADTAPSSPPARRPAPRPPVGSRPRRLSATQVETLVRDPFALYARRVLGLRALPELGRAPDARDRGAAVDIVMRRLAALPGGSLDGLLAAFDAAVEAGLAEATASPAQRRLWRMRLVRGRDRFVAEEVGRRALAADIRVELEGVRRDPGLDAALTARADRVDVRHDGSVAIYDYKSGAPPTQREIAVVRRQLPLEAAIAAAGGFTDGRPAAVSALAHIGFAPADAGAEAAVRLTETTAPEASWAGFLALIRAYDDPARGFPARALPKFATDHGDYDHLARRGEWEDGDAPAADGP